MQSIQDRLDFKIDTPSDLEVMERFAREQMEPIADHLKGGRFRDTKKKPVTQNQKKRARKAKRKARKATTQFLFVGKEENRMCYLEPPDQIKAACTECGEDEQIEHIDGAQWRCILCDDTFSDGSDLDDSDFHDQF